MEWRYQAKVSRCPSPRRSKRIPRHHFRQVPLKSLATTTLLMMTHQNGLLEAGGGLARAAEVSEQQAIEQQVKVEQQVEEKTEAAQQEQLDLEEKLKEAQELEQKLRVQLQEQTKDAEADGLEDNDYAINSIEEFVDADEVEEAGRKGSRPAQEMSQKHTTVAVSHNKAQNHKAAAKPKSLSMKKLNSAQTNKKQSNNKQNKAGQKKTNMAQKQQSSQSPAKSPHKEPIKSAKQNKPAQKKQQGGVKAPGHAGSQSMAQAPAAGAGQPHHSPVKKSTVTPPKKSQQASHAGRAASASSTASHHASAPHSAKTAAPSTPAAKKGGGEAEMNDLDKKRKAIQATLAALKGAKKDQALAMVNGMSSKKSAKKAEQQQSSNKQHHDSGKKEHQKEASKPASPPAKPALPKPVAANPADPEARAATQLSADALEYSMQALESSAQDNESMMDQSAALNEVEVIQPKHPAPKEPKHEQKKAPVAPIHAQKEADKKKQQPKKESHSAQKQHHTEVAPKPVKTQQSKPDLTHPKQPKSASPVPAPKKQQHNNNDLQSPVAKPSSPIKPAKQAEHSLSQSLATHTKKEKAKSKSVDLEHAKKPLQSTGAKPVAAPTGHPAASHAAAGHGAAGHSSAGHPSAAHTATHAASPVSSSAQHLSQSEKKHSEAHKASQVAKQFREKADELKKQKMAMQAQAADLSIQQHEAIVKQEAKKEHVSPIKEKKDVKEVKKQVVKKEVKKEKEVKKDVQKKSHSPQDLIAQAIKHQKKQVHEAAAPIEDIAAPKKVEKAKPKPVEKKQPIKEHVKKPQPSPSPKPAADSQEMLEANEILSGLGKDHFNEVLSIQDIKPEKNMVRIEDSAIPIPPKDKQVASTKPPAVKKEELVHKQAAPKDHQLLKQSVHAKQKDNSIESIIKAAEKPKKVEEKVEIKSTDELPIKMPALKTNEKAASLAESAALESAILDDSKMSSLLPKQLDLAAPEAVSTPVVKKPSEAAPAGASSTDLIKKLTANAIANQHKSDDAVLSQPSAQQAPTKAKEEVTTTTPAPSLAEMPKTAVPAAANDPIAALLAGQGVADQSQLAGAIDVNSMADIMGQQDFVGKLLGETGAKKDTNQKKETSQEVKSDAKKVTTDAKSPDELTLPGIKPVTTPKKTQALGEVPLPGQDAVPKPFDLPQIALTDDQALSGQSNDAKKDSMVQSILANIKKEDNGKNVLTEKQESATPILKKESPITEAKAQVGVDLNLDQEVATMTQGADKIEAPMKTAQKPPYPHRDGKQSESLEVLMQKFAQSDETHPDDQALTQKIIQKVKAQDQEEQNVEQQQEIQQSIATISTPDLDLPAAEKKEPKLEVKPTPIEPKQKNQELALPQPKPVVVAEKPQMPLLDIPEPIKPAPSKQPVQSLPQTKDKAAGDYGEEEFKAFENMDGAFPSNKDHDDPLDMNKLEAEIKQAAMGSLKNDIKEPTKKVAKDSKSTASLIGKTSSPVKKEAPQKKAQVVHTQTHNNHLSTKKKIEAPKTATKKQHQTPVQSIVQVKSDSVLKTEDFGPFKTHKKSELKKEKQDHKKPKAASKIVSKSVVKSSPKVAQTVAKSTPKQAVKSEPKPAAKPIAKPASKPVKKYTVSPKLTPKKQVKQPSVTPSKKHNNTAAPAKPVQPAQSLVTKTNLKKTTHAQPPSHTPKSKKIKQQSLLGHQNQIEQQLDEKIRKKVEEDDENDEDINRVQKEIKQVMAQDDPKPKDDKPKEEKPKEEKPKDDKPKDDKPKDDKPKDDKPKDDKPKEEKKDDKKDDAPAPKKPAFDDDDPLIADSDYYYGDDPYFVRRQPSRQSSRQPSRQPRMRRPKQIQQHSRYIDEDILDSLNDNQLMHRMLQDLHIHDDHSIHRAIEYLQQHVQKDNLALTDLLKKYKELTESQSKIKTTQDNIIAERDKIHKLLEQLIAKMEQDRSSTDTGARDKLKKLQQEEAERKKEEQKELLEQEKIARAIVEQEHQKIARSDEINERQMELKRKEERVKQTLHAVKAEEARVKKDISITNLHKLEAQRAAQHWQEKQTEKIGKDKDQLLEKYLKSRSQHETELRQAQNSVKQHKSRQGSLNHLTQTQEPKRNADEFDTPHDSMSHDSMPHDSMDHYHYSDFDHDLYKEDSLPRMRRSRPYPRRRAPEGYYDHPEDAVPDAVGSPDLLDRIQELKRLQGRDEYPHPHKNDFYEDAHQLHGYHDDHYNHDMHNYNRRNSRNSRDRMHSSRRSTPRISHDTTPLPPFKPTKGDVKNSVSKIGKDDQYDGMDYYDYGPYGPVTGDIPKRISKKIDYMRDLRKNSPLSDKVIQDDEREHMSEKGSEDAQPENLAEEPQDFDFVSQKEEKATKHTMSKIDDLMKQVKNFQKGTQNTQSPEAKTQSTTNSTKQAESKI